MAAEGSGFGPFEVPDQPNFLKIVWNICAGNFVVF